MEENESELPYRPVEPYRPNKDTGFVPSQGYDKYRSPGFHRENEIRRAMARLRTMDRARAEEYLGISNNDLSIQMGKVYGGSVPPSSHSRQSSVDLTNLGHAIYNLEQESNTPLFESISNIRQAYGGGSKGQRLMRTGYLVANLQDESLKIPEESSGTYMPPARKTPEMLEFMRKRAEENAAKRPIPPPVSIETTAPDPVPVPAASAKTAKVTKATKPRVYGVPIENINDTYRVVDKHSAKYSDKQKQHELEQWKSGKGKGRSVRDPATPSALGGLVRLGQAIGAGDVDPQAGEAFKKIADAYSPITFHKSASERITEGEDWWVERYGRGNDPYKKR